MVGIVEIEVEGPLPPGINGGMFGNVVAIMGSPIVGNKPEAMCVVGKGPLVPGPIGLVEGMLVMIGGIDVIPLLTIPP